MIPLSKAVMHMSVYNRTRQELNWYEESFYLCTTEFHMARKIEEECRRRVIDYEFLFVRERSKDKRKEVSEGVMSKSQKYDIYPGVDFNYHMLKIKVNTGKTTALERKELADWAITTFNANLEADFCDDLDHYYVWIQPSKDVQVTSLGEEHHYLKYETHCV